MGGAKDVPMQEEQVDLRLLDRCLVAILLPRKNALCYFEYRTRKKTLILLTPPLTIISGF